MRSHGLDTTSIYRYGKHRDYYDRRDRAPPARTVAGSDHWDSNAAVGRVLGSDLPGARERPARRCGIGGGRAVRSAPGDGRQGGRGSTGPCRAGLPHPAGVGFGTGRDARRVVVGDGLLPRDTAAGRPRRHRRSPPCARTAAHPARPARRRRILVAPPRPGTRHRSRARHCNRCGLVGRRRPPPARRGSRDRRSRRCHRGTRRCSQPIYRIPAGR